MNDMHDRYTDSIISLEFKAAERQISLTRQAAAPNLND